MIKVMPCGATLLRAASTTMPKYLSPSSTRVLLLHRADRYGRRAEPRRQRRYVPTCFVAVRLTIRNEQSQKRPKIFFSDADEGGGRRPLFLLNGAESSRRPGEQFTMAQPFRQH